jgi:hypothetical protein
MSATRLSKLFNDVIYDKTKLAKRTYHPFLEAVYTHTDPPTCLDKLISSKSGIPALLEAIRHDPTPAFFTGDAARLLEFLAAPELKKISSGKSLATLLKAIVEPPIVWRPFVEAIKARQLDEAGKQGFAWLLYNLLDLFPPHDAEQYCEPARDSTIMDQLLSSTKFEVRELAQKIKHAASSMEREDVGDLEDGPGGRHDNDFVDFRQIAIIPTADEIHSSQDPFLRPSYMFDQEKNEKARLGVYLDNQFRLLREDMLYEIREEIQAEKKRKKHRNVVITDLALADAHHALSDTDPDLKKRGLRWAIVLQCRAGFGQLEKKDVTQRKNWLRDNRIFLKHQSIACLLAGEELIALTTIDRDEDLLSQLPPKIVVQIEGSASISRTLLRLKTAEQVKLIQINAPIFAYEPVLDALQNTKAIPLSKELLFWKNGMRPESLDDMPSRTIESLRQNPTQNLQPLLQSPKTIILDPSQSDSLLMGLTQSLSLIQGPPGAYNSLSMDTRN